MMTNKLSEQLSELSVRAKHAEDAFSTAQKEAHDKMEARKQQARVAATTAVEKVNQEIKSANNTAARNWSAVKAKIDADMDTLKAKASTVKHKLDVKTAEDYADEMEWEAGFAVDYAIASVEQATLAVLDAIDSRARAELKEQV
jgi:predicted  nucleic acid-binding Zn-ribbon protein